MAYVGSPSLAGSGGNDSGGSFGAGAGASEYVSME